MVDVQFIQREVDIEDDADDGRNDAFRGGGLEVDELDDCCHRDVHEGHLVDLVDGGVDVRCVFRVPTLLFGAVGEDDCEPAQANQEHRHVDIVNEETGLACPLEAPVHGVSREQQPIVIHFLVYLLRVSDLVLDSRRNEPLCLIRDLLVGRSIKEDKGRPDPDSLV